MGMFRVLFTTIMLLMLSMHADAQWENLSPEQQRLEFIRGHWTVEGLDSMYIEACEWIQGGHMQCISAYKELEAFDKSFAYFTWSPDDQAYFFYGIYGNGISRMLRGQWVESHFVFEGNQMREGKQYHTRITFTPDTTGITLLEESSIEGGPWQVSATFTYKKIK